MSSWNFIPEDFAGDIELTEEEQIKLLEQYEEEKKKERSSPKNSNLIGENVVFKQTSPKKDKEENGKKGSNIETGKLNKNDSAASLGTPSSSSSTDDDWEKINDIEKEFK